jgi:hypothetical protein
MEEKRFLLGITYHFSWICLLFFLMSACQQQDVIRHYQERIDDSTDTVSKKTDKANLTENRLNWIVPPTWKLVDSQSPMRLATFETNQSQKPLICTVSKLSGNGGGIFPNVSRWLNQLNISISELQAKEFINRQDTWQVNNQYQGLLLDFTSLTKPDQPSMLAAVIHFSDFTLFIKFNGISADLQIRKHEFASFCQSIAIQPEKS